MKIKISLFFSLMFSFLYMFAQDLKPNEFKALVNIEVTNLENSPIQNELVIFLSKDDDNEFMATTNEEGKAQLLLPKGKSYEVKYKDLIEKVKHSSFDVPGGRGKYSFDISIKFEPSDMVILKGLIFDENQVLEEGLNLELEMMLEVLSLNKKMEIQVAAHSDNSEGKEKSLEITQKQAESIKAYFVKNGISSDRIKTIGVGMDEPVGSNALPAGRESNNRIEIRVIKKYF